MNNQRKENKSTFYQFRIDEQEKREVFQIFEELGITPAQAIKMFLRQVKETRSIPFSVSLSHKENAENL